MARYVVLPVLYFVILGVVLVFILQDYHLYILHGAAVSARQDIVYWLEGFSYLALVVMCCGFGFGLAPRPRYRFILPGTLMAIIIGGFSFLVVSVLSIVGWLAVWIGFRIGGIAPHVLQPGGIFWVNTVAVVVIVLLSFLLARRGSVALALSNMTRGVSPPSMSITDTNSSVVQLALALLLLGLTVVAGLEALREGLVAVWLSS